MKFSIRTFIRNIFRLGQYDIKQMIDFERELMDQHNATIEDIKGINFILKREHGYDTGIFIPRRSCHMDVLTRVKPPLTIPMAIAEEVEQTLMSQDRERLARVQQATENKTPVPVAVAVRVRKAARRRRK